MSPLPPPTRAGPAGGETNATARPRFSIVTPALNQLPFLRRCCASVRDQADVTVEHIVVDGASTDGTVDWLRAQGDLRWISARDRGMYDAIGKGIALARGEIIAYLNCDEQYLEGTLSRVARFMETHPAADAVHGDMLVIRPDGSLLSFRKSYRLRWPYVLAAHLYAPSCVLFWRRRVFDTGLAFDPRWRTVGDADFVVRALRAGHRTAHLRGYLSAFTATGSNLGGQGVAAEETERLRRGGPAFVGRFRWVLNAARLAEKGLSGAWFGRRPIAYAVYDAAAQHRQNHVATPANWRWPES